jgi:hypothetical protein
MIFQTGLGLGISSAEGLVKHIQKPTTLNPWNLIKIISIIWGTREESKMATQCANLQRRTGLIRQRQITAAVEMAVAVEVGVRGRW